MKKLIALIAFGIVFILSGCKKDGVEVKASEEFYYEALIGGVQYKEVIPFNNTDTSLMATSSMVGSGSGYFGSFVENLGINGTSMGIFKGLLINYPNSTLADFKNHFNPGSYSYVPYLGNGISIIWFDKNAVEWSTFAGSGNQLGSSFSIQSIEDVPAENGIEKIKVKASFNCKLYDGNGNVKQALGTYVGRFARIQ